MQRLWIFGLLQSATAFLPHFSSHTVRHPVYGSVRAVETYDGRFVLAPEVTDKLTGFLSANEMMKEVTQHARCKTAEFTGMLFQPVPYSEHTKFGMPAEFEPYHNNPEYALIQVPPLIMFKSQCFKPPRLCAIYKIDGLDPEQLEIILRKRAAHADLAASVDTSSLEDEDLWSRVGAAMKEVITTRPEEDDDDVDLDSMVV